MSNNKQQRQVIVTMRTHNSADFIEKSLNSIASQTYKNIKVVLFDDASTDNTLKKVDLIKSKTGLDIIVEKSEINGGCAYAAGGVLKKALEVSKNSDDLLFKLDSDDWINSNNVVEEIVEKVETSGANILVTAYTHAGNENLILSQGGGTPHQQTVAKIAAKKDAIKVSEMPSMVVSLDSLGCSKVVTAGIARQLDAVNKKTPLKYKVCEDFFEVDYMLLKEARITALNTPYFCYNKREASATAQPTKHDFDTRLFMLEKTVDIVCDNPNLFVNNADVYAKMFVANKFNVISNIIAMKKEAGFLSDYSVEMFKKGYDSIFEEKPNVIKIDKSKKM